MSESNIERQIIEELEHWDKSAEEEKAKLERDIRRWGQSKETKRNLWKLRRDTFLEKKWQNWKYIFYKLDAVNNYLKETATSNTKIKESLFNDRKTIVMAVQIALYKSWYLPVWQIDWLRWPITRKAVAKFQKENWLWKQKNPWYLNVNTLNKLIEVSSKKEEEKNQKKNVQKKFPRKVINIPAPDSKIVEQPDATKISKTPAIIKRKKIDFKKEIPQKQQIESEKKWWTMEEVRLDITNKVWDFREWHNWDYRFAFKNSDNNGNWGLPEQITVCGETYKYNWEWNELNWLWFETSDWWRAFQLWTYVNGTLEEWFRFYFDWVKEVGEFDYVWDLKNGVRIKADWSQYKVRSDQSNIHYEEKI